MPSLDCNPYRSSSVADASTMPVSNAFSEMRGGVGLAEPHVRAKCYHVGIIGGNHIKTEEHTPLCFDKDLNSGK